MKSSIQLLTGKTMAALCLSAALITGCKKSDTAFETNTTSTEILSTESANGVTTDEVAGELPGTSARVGLFLDAGFEGTNPFQGMSTVQTATSYGITASTTQAHEGVQSFKSVVKRTDPSISSGYRSEITFPGISDQGERWYGYSTYFESNPLGGGHVIQWHPTNSNGSATLSLWTGDGKFMVVRNPSGTNINYYQPNPRPIIQGKWYDIVWHVKWSSSSDGLIEMWIDGEKYYTYNGVTAQTGVYLKLGQNLWVRENDGIIYYDNVRIGGPTASYDDVAPATNVTVAPPVVAEPPVSGNQLPVVSAGADQTVVLPTNRATLTGTASDVDGAIVSYKWTKVSGPYGGGTSATTATTTAKSLLAGTYVYKLTVKDNEGGTASSNVTINVLPATSTPPPPTAPPTTTTPPVTSAPSTNIAPVVNAGANKTITLPVSSVTLSGSATDADGTVVSYRWSKYYGPSGSATSATTTTTTVTGLKAGTYIYKLMATDNQGATGSAMVTITVNPAPVVTTPPAPPAPDFGLLTFQTGYDNASDVNTNQGPRNSISTTIKKTGAASFRSEVRSTDQSTSSGYRGEMQYNGTATNPTEGVVEYDVYYENWRNFGGGGHSMQWHPDNGNGSATLCLYSYNGKFQVVRNLGSKYDGANYYQSGTLMTITPNKWYNMRWEYKWATSGGYIRLYIDNVLYYSFSGETMNSTTGMPYMKVGQNRWSMPSNTNTVVYYDNLKVYTK